MKRMVSISTLFFLLISLKFGHTADPSSGSPGALPEPSRPGLTGTPDTPAAGESISYLEATANQLDTALFSWMVTAQKAKANKLRGLWESLLASFSPASAPTGMVIERLVSWFPSMKGMFKRPSFGSRQNTPNNFLMKTPLTGQEINQPVATTTNPELLKNNIKALNNQLIQAIPNDRAIDTAHMGAFVTAVARYFFADWMLRSIPFGIYPMGNYEAKILKESMTHRGQPDSPLVNYFSALEKGNGEAAAAALSDLAAILMNIPCNDLGKIQKNFDDSVVQLRAKTVELNQGFAFTAFFNALLPISVMMADMTVSCHIKPSLAHFTIRNSTTISSSDSAGADSAAPTSLNGTLIGSLATTPSFSFKTVGFWLMDPKVFRLRKYGPADLPNPVDFLAGAFLNLNGAAGACTGTEKIFAGNTDFSCPACGGAGGNKGSPESNSATSTTASLGLGVDNLATPGGGGTGSGEAWGRGCASGRRSGGGGGGGFGNMGQCYGRSFASRGADRSRDRGGEGAREEGRLMECTLKAVGGGGINLGIDQSSIPKGGSPCSTRLDSTDAGRVTPPADPRTDPNIRSLDGHDNSPGNVSHGERLAAWDPRFNPTEARYIYASLVRQVQSGEISVIYTEQQGGGNPWEIMGSEEGGYEIIISASQEESAEHGYLREALDILTLETLAANPGAGESGPPNRGIPSWDGTRQSRSRPSRGLPPTEEVFRSCDPESSCGSSACGFVPEVIQRFTDCLNPPSTIALRPDPCATAMCLDGPGGGGDFAGVCMAHIGITDNGCATVACPSAGMAGAMSTEVSRCCTGGGTSGSGNTVNRSVGTGGVFDPCRFGQGPGCGSGDGNPISTVPGGGLPPEPGGPDGGPD